MTDTIGQRQRAGVDTGAVEFSIAYAQIQGHKTAEITDPSWLVVCGDGGGGPELETAWVSLYATTNPCCCLGMSEEDACRYMTDPSFRKRYTPHMGGANFGFADGHAAWWDAEALLVEAGGTECCADETGNTDCYWKPDGKIHGFCPWFNL